MDGRLVACLFVCLQLEDSIKVLNKFWNDTVSSHLAFSIAILLDL